MDAELILRKSTELERQLKWEKPLLGLMTRTLDFIKNPSTIRYQNILPIILFKRHSKELFGQGDAFKTRFLPFASIDGKINTITNRR